MQVLQFCLAGFPGWVPTPGPEAVPRIMPRMDRVRPIEPPPALELGLGQNPENLEGRRRGTGSHPGRAQPALALEVTRDSHTETRRVGRPVDPGSADLRQHRVTSLRLSPLMISPLKTQNQPNLIKLGINIGFF